MVTVKQIHYALMVEKKLHFKKAADACYVSPSTLSNAISEMESQLGVQVFERTNKKVIVTNIGKIFLKKAKDIKSSIDEINQLSESQNKPLTMPINLGIIPTIGPYFIPLVLPALQKEFPDLKLKIIEAQSMHLLKKLIMVKLIWLFLQCPIKLKGFYPLNSGKRIFITSPITLTLAKLKLKLKI